jgi:hypothetical protein
MKEIIAAVLFTAVSMTLSAPVEADGAKLAPDTNGFVILQPGEETWQEIPGLDGVSYMRVYGDSSQPGVYVVRIRFQPWTMTMPHVHSQERLVVVIKGTWYAGTDTQFDPANTTPIRAGGYMLHPANGVHFDGARDEEVVLQITGPGPMKTTFLDPGGERVRKLK